MHACAVRTWHVCAGVTPIPWILFDTAFVGVGETERVGVQASLKWSLKGARWGQEFGKCGSKRSKFVARAPSGLRRGVGAAVRDGLGRGCVVKWLAGVPKLHACIMQN